MRKLKLREAKEFELGHTASTGPGVLGWWSQSLGLLSRCQQDTAEAISPHSIVITFNANSEKFMHFYLIFFPKLSIRFYCFHHGGR